MQTPWVFWWNKAIIWVVLNYGCCGSPIENSLGEWVGLECLVGEI
jgi:hypothetical protein